MYSDKHMKIWFCLSECDGIATSALILLFNSSSVCYVYTQTGRRSNWGRYMTFPFPSFGFYSFVLHLSYIWVGVFLLILSYCGIPLLRIDFYILCTFSLYALNMFLFSYWFVECQHRAGLTDNMRCYSNRWRLSLEKQEETLKCWYLNLWRCPSPFHPPLSISCSSGHWWLCRRWDWNLWLYMSQPAGVRIWGWIYWEWVKETLHGHTSHICTMFCKKA